MSHDGVDSKFYINFETIVAFATGCPSEPPGGFEPPPISGIPEDQSLP